MRLLPLLLLTACVDADAPLHPGQDEPILYEVPAGSSASRLTPALVEFGVLSSDWQWKWFLRGTDASCVKAGRHELKRSMSMREVLASLCAAPIPDDEPFTVVEGWRIRDIDAALAAKGWIKAGEYTRLAESKAVTLPFEVPGKTLEGYLFPDTYRVEPKKLTAKGFIERQLTTFQERFASKNPNLGGRTLHDVVIVASLVEREEPTKNNRPVVAGVIWKRLDAKWNLGIDASSRYVLEDWNDREAFLARLRDPEDPYNTRLRGGLPPTPIGNPGIESLEAAGKPQASEFWYYLHDANGVLHGGKTAAEHEANRAKYNVY